MKKKKIMTGVAASVLAISVAAPTTNANATPQLTEEQKEMKCNNWKLNKETNAYECVEQRSSSSGMFFYMGSYYNNQSSLMNSAPYKTTQNRLIARQNVKLNTGVKANTSTKTNTSVKTNTKTVNAKPKTSLKGNVKGTSGIGRGASGSFGG